jgi:transposase
MEEFSADKGYLSRENYNILFSYGALPLIPFKSNVTGKRSGGSMIWTEMYNFFKKNNELFMKKYHLRSNAEAGFFMIKQRFGDLTNCRKETSSKNEVLVKILCHNLCVLVQEIFNLKIDFNFAQIRKEVTQANKL